MRRKAVGFLSAISLISAISFVAYMNASSQRISDDYVYNEMATITGTVTILNHPEMGVAPDSGAYLVFQREGCKHCLVATHADVEGRYKIIVGRGRYKVIYYNPSPPTYDLLAPDQSRYVEANNISADNVFDIKVMLPIRR